MTNSIPLGICTGPDQVACVADSYDYVELSVAGTLDPLRDDAAFAEDLARLKDLALPVRACNSFVAPEVRLVGPGVNPDLVKQYIDRAFGRAEVLGVERIVFGSGGARRVPEGYSREAAWEQLIGFCRLCSARAYPGLILVIEPLNLGECNILTSFPEAVQLARDVDLPNIRVLADIYHMEVESEPLSVLPAGADLLEHVHLADSGRLYPGSGTYPLRELFAMLHELGYAGRASVECRWGAEFATEASAAARFLRPLAG